MYYQPLYQTTPDRKTFWNQTQLLQYGLYAMNHSSFILARFECTTHQAGNFWCLYDEYAAAGLQLSFPTSQQLQTIMQLMNFEHDDQDIDDRPKIPQFPASFTTFTIPKAELYIALRRLLKFAKTIANLNLAKRPAKSSENAFRDDTRHSAHRLDLIMRFRYPPPSNETRHLSGSTYNQGRARPAPSQPSVRPPVRSKIKPFQCHFTPVQGGHSGNLFLKVQAKCTSIFRKSKCSVFVLNLRQVNGKYLVEAINPGDWIQRKQRISIHDQVLTVNDVEIAEIVGRYNRHRRLQLRYSPKQSVRIEFYRHILEN